MLTISELINKGIIIIDKSKKTNSHEVSEKVKNILAGVGAEKAGHSGTLDPYVTGVLVIALNDATPLLNYLIKKDKIYEGYLRFSENITKKKAQEIFNNFIGKIEQMPPRKCAVKRQMRKKHIYSFKAYKKIKTETNKADVYFKIKCEAGTYIRSIARDISDKYSTCRLMTLRRTAVGDIKEKDAFTLDELKKAYFEEYKKKGNEKPLRKIIKPVEYYVKKEMPIITVDKNAVVPLMTGHVLYIPGIIKIKGEFKKGESVALFTEKNKLIEIAEALEDSETIKQLNKGIATKPVRVIMK
ncbi:MAG: RNA-guided pseudouridylation complex pseudouridine synthase subunit Cbf5 [Candidatus Micrarchaeia archaeon]|jgi:H/ACA ribonucleoprotein complex subunit 4